jgi:hypothetical protein
VPGRAYEVVRASGDAELKRLARTYVRLWFPLREGWVAFAGTACIGPGRGGLDRTFVDLARAMLY